MYSSQLKTASYHVVHYFYCTCIVLHCFTASQYCSLYTCNTHNVHTLRPSCTVTFSSASYYVVLTVLYCTVYSSGALRMGPLYKYGFSYSKYQYIHTYCILSNLYCKYWCNHCHGRVNLVPLRASQVQIMIKGFAVVTYAVHNRLPQKVHTSRLLQ